MKCPHCNADAVRMINVEPLDLSGSNFDTEIYATWKCDECGVKENIVGDIIWRDNN